jgi:hypothetical protein
MGERRLPNWLPGHFAMQQMRHLYGQRNLRLFVVMSGLLVLWGNRLRRVMAMA